MTAPGSTGRAGLGGAGDPGPGKSTGQAGSGQVVHTLSPEKRIARLTSLYKALSHSTEAMFRESDPHRMCAAVCRIAVIEGGLVSSSVRLFDPAKNLLVPYCGYGPLAGWIGERPIDLNEPRSRAAWSARTLQPYFSDDIWNDPAVSVARADAELIGVRSSGGLPLAIDGELVGVFSVYAAEPHYFDEEIARLLGEMARNLSFAFAKDRAESALKRSEAYYRSLFHAMPQAVRVLVDEKVVLLNPAGEQLFGMPGGSAIGQSAFDCLDPEFREGGRARLREVIEKRVMSPAREMTVVRSDGVRVPVEATLLPIEFEGRPAALSIVHDLTGRKEAEKRVQRLTSLYAALSRTNEAIFRHSDTKSLCEAVCEIAVVHGALVSASIRMLNKETGMLEFTCGHGPLNGRIGRSPLAASSTTSPVARVLRERRAYFSNNLPGTPAIDDTNGDGRILGVHAVAMLPLIEDGQGVGVLSVYSAEAGFFDLELARLMEEMAQNLSFAFSRMRAAQAAAVNEARYRALFESSPDAILVARDGRVVLLNPAGVRLFGLKNEAELIGKSVFDNVEPGSRELASTRAQTVLRTGQVMPASELRILRADGTPVWVEAVAMPFEIEGRPAVLSYLRDITARKGAEQRIGRLTSLYAALSKTNEAIFRVTDLRELCQVVCQIVVDDGGLFSAAIRLLDKQTGMIEPYTGHGPLLGRIGAKPVPKDSPTSNVSRVLREGGIYVSNDFQNDPRTAEVQADARTLGVRAAAVFPLAQDGHNVGVLSVFAAEAGFFDPEFTRLLEEVALNLSFAFARHQAAAELAVSEGRYRALFESSPDGVAVVAQNKVVLLNPAGRRLFGIGAEEDLLNQSVFGVINATHRDRAMARVREALASGHPLPPAEYPMTRRDGSQVQVEAATLPFEYEDKPAVLIFLRDLTSRYEAQKRIGRLTSLYAALSKTNEAIFRAGELGALCEDVCRIAVEDGGLVSAAIRAYNPSTDKLEPYAGFGPLSGRLGTDTIDLKDTGSNAAMIARNGGHYVCNDIATDPRARASQQDGIKIGVRASSGYALTIDGALAGTLSVFAAEKGYFDNEMVGLLDELARNLSFAFSRQRAAANLRQSEERYRMLFNAAPDAMRVVCEGRIVMINPASARLLGVSGPEVMLGKPMEFTVAPEDHAAVIERVRIVIEERRPLPPADQRLLRADGTRVEVEVVSLPFDFEGKPAVLTIAHDLTERKAHERSILHLNAELEDRVVRRTAELKQAIADLESFSYTVAHDLRAPLRRMSGFASLLRENLRHDVDEEDNMFLERIQDGVQTMDRLIEGLLELAQLGRARLRCAPVDLSTEAQSVAAALRARDPGRVCEFVIEPDLIAWADPRFIRDVLDNLMGNAWKFTSAHPTARIEFGALDSAQYPADAPQRVYFVRDDGAGFDEKYAAKLYGTFQRLHGQDEFAGTGIGLASVKRIIAHHGGKVWAEGKPEQGATFYFTLPQTEAAMGEPPLP